MRSKIKIDEPLTTDEMQSVADGLNHLDIPSSWIDCEEVFPRISTKTDIKPSAPRIVPPSSIKHQEGLWRGELVRVADTDVDTLKVPERTGLDKPAPPIPDAPKESIPIQESLKALTPLEKARLRHPRRNVDADQALFEEELDRLFDTDIATVLRAERNTDTSPVPEQEKIPQTPRTSAIPPEPASVTTGRGKKDVDIEADLHGLTAEQMRVTLQQHWPQWQGKQVIRIIHGQGTVLRPEVERWCREMGIPVAIDPGNPGALKIYPRERHTAGTGNENGFGVSLRDSGLRLTPEQEALLRDPQAMARFAEAERRRKAEEEGKRREDAATRRAQQKRDEDLWLAEMARLESIDRRKDWSVMFSHELHKTIGNLDKALKARVLEAIFAIGTEPMTPKGDTVKPLEGKEFAGCWRYRIGDSRLIYYPNKERRQVLLMCFKPRGEAYT